MQHSTMSTATGSDPPKLAVTSSCGPSQVRRSPGVLCPTTPVWFKDQPADVVDLSSVLNRVVEQGDEYPPGWGRWKRRLRGPPRNRLLQLLGREPRDALSSDPMCCLHIREQRGPLDPKGGNLFGRIGPTG